MPPRQRPSSKAQAKKSDSGRNQQEQGDTGNRTEGAGLGGPEGGQQRARRGGVSWSPVFKRIGVFLLIILIPTLVNYAALNQEARMLVPEGMRSCHLGSSDLMIFIATGGVLYDVGWNQKMLLKCAGQGLPTGRMEWGMGMKLSIQCTPVRYPPQSYWKHLWVKVQMCGHWWSLSLLRGQR